MKYHINLSSIDSKKVQFLKEPHRFNKLIQNSNCHLNIIGNDAIENFNFGDMDLNSKLLIIFKTTIYYFCIFLIASITNLFIFQPLVIYALNSINIYGSEGIIEQFFYSSIFLINTYIISLTLLKLVRFLSKKDRIFTRKLLNNSFIVNPLNQINKAREKHKKKMIKSQDNLFHILNYKDMNIRSNHKHDMKYKAVLEWKSKLYNQLLEQIRQLNVDYANSNINKFRFEQEMVDALKKINYIQSEFINHYKNNSTIKPQIYNLVSRIEKEKRKGLVINLLIFGLFLVFLITPLLLLLKVQFVSPFSISFKHELNFFGYPLLTSRLSDSDCVIILIFYLVNNSLLIITSIVGFIAKKINKFKTGKFLIYKYLLSNLVVVLIVSSIFFIDVNNTHLSSTISQIIYITKFLLINQGYLEYNQNIIFLILDYNELNFTILFINVFILIVIFLFELYKDYNAKKVMLLEQRIKSKLLKPVREKAENTIQSLSSKKINKKDYKKSKHLTEKGLGSKNLSDISYKDYIIRIQRLFLFSARVLLNLLVIFLSISLFFLNLKTIYGNILVFDVSNVNISYFINSTSALIPFNIITYLQTLLPVIFTDLFVMGTFYIFFTQIFALMREKIENNKKITHIEIVLMACMGLIFIPFFGIGVILLFMSIILLRYKKIQEMNLIISREKNYFYAKSATNKGNISDDVENNNNPMSSNNNFVIDMDDLNSIYLQSFEYGNHFLDYEISQNENNGLSSKHENVNEISHDTLYLPFFTLIHILFPTFLSCDHKIENLPKYSENIFNKLEGKTILLLEEALYWLKKQPVYELIKKNYPNLTFQSIPCTDMNFDMDFYYYLKSRIINTYFAELVILELPIIKNIVQIPILITDINAISILHIINKYNKENSFERLFDKSKNPKNTHNNQRSLMNMVIESEFPEIITENSSIKPFLSGFLIKLGFENSNTIKQQELYYIPNKLTPLDYSKALLIANDNFKEFSALKSMKNSKINESHQKTASSELQKLKSQNQNHNNKKIKIKISLKMNAMNA